MCRHASNMRLDATHHSTESAALGAGPFAIVPGSQLIKLHAAPNESPPGSPRHRVHASSETPNTLTTHFAPPGLVPLVQHTMKVFSHIFAHYETFLGTKYPYPMLQQVCLGSSIGEHAARRVLFILL